MYCITEHHIFKSWHYVWWAPQDVATSWEGRFGAPGRPVGLYRSAETNDATCWHKSAFVHAQFPFKYRRADPLWPAAAAMPAVRGTAVQTFFGWPGCTASAAKACEFGQATREEPARPLSGRRCNRSTRTRMRPLVSPVSSWSFYVRTIKQVAVFEGCNGELVKMFKGMLCGNARMRSIK